MAATVRLKCFNRRTSNLAATFQKKFHIEVYRTVSAVTEVMTRDVPTRIALSGYIPNSLLNSKELLPSLIAIITLNSANSFENQSTKLPTRLNAILENNFQTSFSISRLNSISNVKQSYKHTDESSIIHMIDKKFYLNTALKQTTDSKNALMQMEYYKQLVSFLLRTSYPLQERTLRNIAEVFEEYFSHFRTPPFVNQREILTTSVKDILSIFDIHSELLSIWLDEKPSFALFSFVWNNKFSNDIDLLNLISMKSEELAQWFIRNLWGYFLSTFKYAIHSTSIHNFEKNYLRFVKAIEVAPISVAKTLWHSFEAYFLKDQSPNDSIILLMPLSEEYKIMILGGILKRPKVDSGLVYQLMTEGSIVMMFGDSTRGTPVPIDDLKIKAMKVSNHSTKFLARKFMEVSGMNLTSFTFNSSYKISSWLLLCLFNFFKNPTKINSQLIELTEAIQLKMNLYDDSKFRMILNHLYDSFCSYQKGAEFLLPTMRFLTELNIDEISNDSTDVEYDIEEVQLKMDQFRDFVLRLYINCKWRCVVTKRWENQT